MKKIINLIIMKTLYVLMKFFSILPVINDLVIFESQNGGRFDDNPKAIFDYLSSEHPNNFKLIWSIRYRDRKIIENENIYYVYRFSIKWAYLMSRAHFWIINARMPKWLPKRKETVYIQTWHGTPLKKLGLDMTDIHMPDSELNAYHKNFLIETQKWDALIAPNQYSKDIFESAFRFKGDFIESGYPRNDVLHKKNTTEYIDDIKRKLGIPLDKKVIMYAPTWRDDYYYGKGRYKFKLPFSLDKLANLLGKEAVFIFRMHYLVADSIDLKGRKDILYNFSNNVDISDLYLISDMLITDYSSVFFDYANLKRPMLFYSYDLEHYRDTLRGFYFNLELQSPGPVVKDEDKFYEALKLFLKDGEFLEYEKQISEFTNEFCSWETGHSSEKIASYMLKIKDKKLKV